MKKTFRQALLVSYLEKYGIFLISLGTSAVLSRLLSPSEVGVFSIAAVLVGFAGTFRDFGSGSFIIQTAELTPQKICLTFTIALIIGSLIAITLPLLAWPIADFYGEQNVREIIHILAATFLVVPLGSITLAILAREMRFDVIARINFTAAVVNSVVAILLAWLNFGPTSLAWGMLASSVCTAAISFAFRPNDFHFCLSVKGYQEVFSFGGMTTASQLANDVTGGAPDLVLGKLSGFDSAGEFSRANGLALAFYQTVLRGLWPVLLPYFSRAQREGTPLRGVYLSMVENITGIGWPFFGLLALLAPEIILVLFGEAWFGSVSVLRVLALWGCFWLAFSFSVPALIAIGEVKNVMRVSIYSLPLRIVVIAVCSYFGATGAAVGVILSSLIMAFYLHGIVSESIHISWSDLFKSLPMTFQLLIWTCAIPLTLKLIINLAPEILPTQIDFNSTISAFFLIITSGAFGMIGFLVGLKLSRHPLRYFLIEHLPTRLTRCLQ